MCWYVFSFVFVQRLEIGGPTLTGEFFFLFLFFPEVMFDFFCLRGGSPKTTQPAHVPRVQPPKTGGPKLDNPRI